MNCNRTCRNNRSGRILSRVLPLVIWLVALAGVVTLYIHRTTSFYVVGIATPQLRSITAMESGLLYSLPVQLYQEVKKGQPLAALRMNTASENDYARALLDAQKATALAEMDRLKAEYLAAEQQFLAPDSYMSPQEFAPWVKEQAETMGKFMKTFGMIK